MAYNNNYNNNNDQLTRVAVKGGKIFGFISLPEPWHSVVMSILPRATQELTKGGAPYVEKGVTTLAKSMNLPDAQAEKIGRLSGKGFAYGFPFIQNIFEFVGTGVQARKYKKELKQLVTPALNARGKGGMFSSATSGNKMIAYANGVIAKTTKRSLSSNSSGLLTSGLNVFSTKLEERSKTVRGGGSIKRRSGEELSGPDALKMLERTENMVTNYGLPAAGAVRAGIDKMASLPDPIQVIKKQTSLGMVLDLQEFMRVSGIGSKPVTDHTVDEIQKKVVNAFQQFQQEQRYGAIPSHSMSEIAEVVTWHLVHGDLHPQSLINIIGREELLNESKSAFLPTDALQEVLTKESRILPRSSMIDPAIFLDGKNFTLADIAGHAQSKDQDEKMLTAWLFPIGVLMAAGMKKEQIFALRDDIKPEEIAKIITVIAQAMENFSDADLKKRYGFTAETNKFIVKCAEDPQAISYALESSEDTENLKRILASALMGEPSDQVQALIAKSKELPDKEIPDDPKGEEQELDDASQSSIKDRYSVKKPEPKPTESHAARVESSRSDRHGRGDDDRYGDDDDAPYTKRHPPRDQDREHLRSKGRDRDEEYAGSHR